LETTKNIVNTVTILSMSGTTRVPATFLPKILSDNEAINPLLALLETSISVSLTFEKPHD